MSQTFDISTNILSILSHLSKAIATLPEPTRGEFQRSLDTLKGDPALQTIPPRWINPAYHDADTVSRDTIRNAQLYLARTSIEINHEVIALQKLAKIVSALKDTFVPHLSRALFPEEGEADMSIVT